MGVPEGWVYEFPAEVYQHLVGKTVASIVNDSECDEGLIHNLY